MAAATSSTCDDFFLPNSSGVTTNNGSFKTKENNFKSFNNKRFDNSRNNRFASNGNNFRSKFGKPKSFGGVNAIPLNGTRNNFSGPSDSSTADGSSRDSFFKSPGGKFQQNENKKFQGKSENWKNGPKSAFSAPNSNGEPGEEVENVSFGSRAAKPSFVHLEGKRKHKFFDETENPVSESASERTQDKSDHTLVKKVKKRKRDIHENGGPDITKQQKTFVDAKNGVLDSSVHPAERRIFTTKGNKVKKGNEDNEIQKSPQGPQTNGNQPFTNGKQFKNNKTKQPERMTSFQKAMLEYQNNQDVKETQKKEKVKKKQEQQDAMAQYKKKKREKSIKLSKKTKKGQPVMKERMEMLLERIQNTIADEEKDS